MSEREAMKLNDCGNLPSLQKADIQVKTDISALSKVLAWFDQFNRPPVPKYIWMQCQLALAEGFTNAVRHAHKGKPPEVPVDIEVTIFPQRLEIRIWDRGQPFDLEQRLRTMPAQVDADDEGGRGLKLMRQIADCLNYTHTDGQGNCLLILKEYPHL
ncbi:ATP-binding protein [Kamptonema formosum]|uniref:ATP-binding protein n=1 Tax=Kamptonema formosum TaxID=331992 RepID=UPI001E62C1D1|nr:anti-sigma regulatory factor [Oscillatoria sp. PCC 10802]